MDPLVTSIASHGLLGVVAAIALYVARSKDIELKEEREARIADAKGYTDLALKLQAQVIDTANKLADTFEEMKRVMSTNRTPGGGR